MTTTEWPLQNATVLVIDDDPCVRGALKRVFTRAGHACLSASAAGEGIEYAKVLRPDAIVLDIDLPDGDGRDVVALLRGDPETSHVPVLIISGNVDHYRRMTALDAGADDVMEKPFDAAMLERKVSWMVSKKRAKNDA
jgi:two-component system, OmpR family, KDP operon response regulator KdpE